jgi:autotransporter-associated beta strand protein
MKPKSNLRHFLAIAGSSLLAISSASAANRYWDGGTTDIAGNGDGVSGGGTGTWDTTIKNWDAGASPYVAWINANNDTAIFAGTSGIVTLGSAVTATALTFSVGGYTITGGTLTMSGTTITASTGTTTIESVIARTGNLTKAGNGTLSLANTANTITGVVSATGGVLEVTKMADAGQSSSIGTFATVAGNFTLNNSTTLRYIGSGDSTDRVARFGSAGGGTVTFDASGSGALNFTSTVAFAGSTNNDTTKTLNLIGSNTDNNTLAIQVTNLSSGTGVMAVSKNGAGTWVLTNTNNTYSGATTVTAGSLIATQAGALSGYTTAGKIVIDGGTLGVRVGGAGWSTGAVDTLLTNATKTSGALGIDTTNGSLTQWTAFTTTNLGSNLGLNKLGSNALTLDQANTYTGATTVTGGTLLVNNTTGSGTGSGAVTVGTDGTLGGSGTIDAAVTVDGFLKPGNSTGLLTVGSLDLNASASTTLEINGLTRGAVTNGYDALGVNPGGSIDLAGALIFEFGNLAAFANNTEFDLFSFTTTSTGDFSGVTSTGFYAGTWSKSGDIWSLTDEGQTLNFSEVTGNLVVVPEPRAALLGGLGLLALLRRRR